MLKNTFVAAAGVILLAVDPAHAITMSGLNPYISGSSIAGDFSGVTELMIVRPDLGAGANEGCSGALLSDGFSILTAAHCLTDRKGTLQATAAYVTFALPGGTYSSGVASFHIHPLYDGSSDSPNDIAVLTLASEAPSGAARYQLYNGTAVGETMTLAGYGLGGVGATGYDEVDFPFGTLRWGENEYDTSLDGDLLFDFDDGTTVHDALGSLGLGSSEAFIAPGDFGGPSFIGGEIAGVHAFAKRRVPCGDKTDIDKILDSSYGEYGRDVSVIYNAEFLQSLLTSAPEPKAMLLIGIGLIVISLMGDSRRQS